MTKIKLRARPVLPCVFMVTAVLLAGSAAAGPSRAARHEDQRAAAPRPSALRTAPAVADHRRLEALYGLVYAFVAERECDDLLVDHDRIVRKLKASGLQPQDLGPGSLYGREIDFMERGIVDSFQENRRLACESAWETVGVAEAASRTAVPSHP